MSRYAFAAHTNSVRLLTACAAGVPIAIAALVIAAPSGAGARTTARAIRQAAQGGRRHAVRRANVRCASAAVRHGGRRHARKRGHCRAAVEHTVHHVELAGGIRGARALACANTTLTPKPGDLAAVREATLCLINHERVARGERTLRPDGRLAQAAQGHSESMAAEDYFAHDGPDGSTPLSRMRAAGYIHRSRMGFEVGENIAWGTLWLATPKAIVDGWMRSPAHRANILDASYRDTGIGVTPHAPASRAGGQAGAIYTQDFGVVVAG